MKPSASLLFWAALLFTSCTQKHDNCAVYSQFAFEENFGNEESKPDTTVFSSLTLGPEWLFPNGPVRGMTYVDERPETIVHGISLPCVNMSSKQNGEIPCQMARRIQSEQFAVMVEMFFEPKDGDAAGLLVSTDNSSSSQVSKGLSSLFFYRDLAGLALRRMNHQGFDLLAETELPDYLTSTDIFYSTKFVDNKTDNTFTVNGQNYYGRLFNSAHIGDSIWILYMRDDPSTNMGLFD